VSGVVEVLRTEFQLPISQDEGSKKLTQKIVEGYNNPSLQLFPGTADLIKALHKTNEYKLAIASSSPKVAIKTMAKHFELEELFDVLVSGEEVKNGKPAPDVFLRTAAVLNVAPTNCVVLEDAPNGIRAAKAAGMKAITVVNKTFYKSEDFGNLSDVLVHSLEEVDANVVEKLFS